MNPWHTGRLLAFDTETTGVDTDTDRIVTAAAILLGGDQPAEQRSWMADPGIEIPEGATAVHGITTEQARAEGRPAAEVVEQILTAIGTAVAGGVTLVGHNIVYDLTLLDREAHRYLGGGLFDAIPAAQMNVIDTMVLDRHACPYRRRVSETQGPYQLRTSAETYGLPWDEGNAHGAEYDAMMAARVACKIGAIAHRAPADRPVWVRQLRTQRFDSMAGVTVQDLHQMQMQWAARDAASFQDWLRTKAPQGKRDPQAVVDGTWPLRPVAEEVPA
ncbi:exonuclease domain-containing protein [Streptomyces sp. NPDC088733]|uniref:exonuclease domain-containing protein n=1 Tax=Streptomyces sp. NPDC088733 TaxID=3365880 RepID=UPI0038191D9F